MKRFFKYTLVTLVLVATLGLASCSKQAGKERYRRPKFQIVSLDKVTGSIGEKWYLTITVANNTASNMRIMAASAFVTYNGRKIGRLALDGEIVLPRRQCSRVSIPLRLTLSHPMAAISLLNNLRKGDFSGVMIDYSITVSSMVAHRVFEQEGVSLEELVKQFNLGLKR